jgi:aldehyde dehydrogenase (NAD+)
VTIDAINPATEDVCATVAICGHDDVEAAVQAVRATFDGYAALSRDARIALADQLIGILERRYDEMVTAVRAAKTAEQGDPMVNSRSQHGHCGPNCPKFAANIAQPNEGDFH